MVLVSPWVTLSCGCRGGGHGGGVLGEKRVGVEQRARAVGHTHCPIFFKDPLHSLFFGIYITMFMGELRSRCGVDTNS